MCFHCNQFINFRSLVGIFFHTDVQTQTKGPLRNYDPKSTIFVKFSLSRLKQVAFDSVWPVKRRSQITRRQNCPRHPRLVRSHVNSLKGRNRSTCSLHPLPSFELFHQAKWSASLTRRRSREPIRPPLTYRFSHPPPPP